MANANRECDVCLITSEVEKIVDFNGASLCQGCYEVRSRQIDKVELLARWDEYIRDIKRKRKGKYDLLFALSGGKDSIAALYYTVKKYDLNPLVFTVDHGFKTDIILQNCLNITKRYNLDWLLVGVSRDIKSEIWQLSSDGDLPCVHCNRLWKEKYFKQVVELSGLNVIFTGGDTLVDGMFEKNRPEWGTKSVAFPLPLSFLNQNEIYSLALSEGWIDPLVTGWDTDCTAAGVSLKNYRELNGTYHVEELKHLSHRVRHGLLKKEDARRMLGEEMTVSPLVFEQFNTNK